MKNKLSLPAATVVCINAMIGSGIFSAPIAIAHTAGPAAILSYLFIIIAIWTMALSFARLCKEFPEDSSFYAYTKPWAGHNGALGITFVYLFGILVASSILMQLAGMYCHSFLPMFSIQQWNTSITLVLAASLAFGIHIAGIWQYILVCATVLPIILTTLLCTANGSVTNFTPFAPFGWTAIFSATKIVIFGFFGFEFSTALYPYIINPEKNVAKALTYSIIIVGILYLGFIASIIYGVPLSYFATQNATIPEIIAAAFPRYALWAKPILNISIISAIIGTIHAMILTLTVLFRKTVSLATCNSFEQSCPINIRSKPLFWISIVSALIIAISQIITDLNLLFGLTALAIVSCYIAAIATLLLKNTQESKIIPVCGIATGCIILYFAIQSII